LAGRRDDQSRNLMDRRGLSNYGYCRNWQRYQKMMAIKKRELHVMSIVVRKIIL
jgi:hypothetical protein